MEKKHHNFMHSSEAADLRGRAEAQIAPNSVQLLPSATEALRMVHELQVQQVELELQNQELEAIRRRLEQSLERYTDLYDFAPVCYATLADDSTIREINLTGAKLLGMERAHLIGQRFGFFVSVDTRPVFNAFLDKALTRVAQQSCEVVLAPSHIPPRSVQIEGVRVAPEADRQCRIAILDTTERKQLEETLRRSLSEKEVLLREVHHRVKNNFAAIISLVELHHENVTDLSTSALLTQLTQRLRSMSLVHELLYESESFDQIDFHRYLQTLTSYLQDAFNPDGAIRLEANAPGVWMSLDYVIPCGLIVNELVTNAFKHSFPEGQTRPGTDHNEIRVSAAWDGTTYTLVIADNGAGLPDALDWMYAPTLGLRLVRMLGQHQLQGHIQFDCTEGTRFTLQFQPHSKLCTDVARAAYP